MKIKKLVRELYNKNKFKFSLKVTLVLTAILFLGGMLHATYGQFSIRGTVHNEKKQAIRYAEVSIPALGLATTSDEKGVFLFKNIPSGKYNINISDAGYIPGSWEININRAIADFSFVLYPDNLKQNEVVVTAKSGTDLTTSYKMDRTALDHMQLLNATDLAALLPGGKTNTVQNLATSSSQALYGNGFSGEMGNSSFGFGVEVDGVRLSTNGLLGSGLTGPDLRNIASSTIENAEFITGVPSVEYGDITNGILKINTQKGITPFIIDALTQPNTKQVALSKGFSPNRKIGIFNFSIEHTKSISSLESPYTSYDRNSLSLNYANTFNRTNGHPLLVEMGISGNIGGYNSKSDPDMFVNTYSKLNDNALRGNFSLKWFLNKPWLTSLEAKGTINYNNRTSESSTNKSASSSTAAIHAMESGYHIGETYADNPNAEVLLIPAGYWYQIAIDDSKLKNYSGSIKARLVKKIGTTLNHFLLGGEYNNSGNNGVGSYYKDFQYAPTWRPYPYNQLPDNINYAVYLEDQLDVPVSKQSKVQLMGGIRSDITAIKGSAYGTVGNLSPRFNARYIFWEHKKQTVQDLSVKIGWGKTVKLPAFYTLYPQPNYVDWLSFAPGTTAGGQTFYAYYTNVSNSIYNPDLKWQYNIQKEISIAANIAGTRVSVTANEDKTRQTYSITSIYSPYTYKLTDQSALENISIPTANRNYTIDRNTGIVTVADNTGAMPSVPLPYKEYTRFIAGDKPSNGSPVIRRRLSWTINFKEISAIKTNFLVDGNYYYYKGVDYTMRPSYPSSSFMSDGSIYKYIGYYVGGYALANGSIDKQLNINVTAVTHIPAIRMVISTRIEGSFYNSSQNLSEYSDGSQRSFVIDNRTDYVASATQTNIYGGNRFAGLYPEYYVSSDDMATKIPFKETFLWAKDNDVTLYNDLAKLVRQTTYNYTFNTNKVSFYYSANIAVTKEIGDIASITFRATNFLNNLSQVKSSWTGNSASLFGSALIPRFYYGLSLRLKL